MARPRVVLIGAGHAHLHVLHNAARLRAAGVEPVLVAPPTFHYSGLATGVLSGALTPDRAQIDVAELAAHVGVRHIPAEVAAVDRTARRLSLTDGQDLTYDAISLNVGSITDDPLGLGEQPQVWTTKPLSGLLDLRVRLEAEDGGTDPVPAIVVAGGGPSGFEIAAALAGRAARYGRSGDVTLVSRGAADWSPPRAMARLSRALAARGVVVLMGEVRACAGGACDLADGRALPCDLLVLATGLTAAPLIHSLGLPMSETGRLRIGPTLQSITDPAVFAVGDCCVIDDHRRPAAGVFGVRAAPILLHNLAALGGAALRRYRPQRQWLSIMDLGDGTGLATRGGLWWMGRTALALKRRLDLDFIARMRAPSGQVLQD